MLARLRALLSHFNPDTILATGILVATAMLLFLASHGWHAYAPSRPATAPPAGHRPHPYPAGSQPAPGQRAAEPSAAAGKR